MAESERLVDNIVRLRRAERIPQVAQYVAPAREVFEEQVGPTLSRSRAARILGVSQTALDRWINLGEIPTLITPTGRTEVPRQFVVEVLELIQELGQSSEQRHPLASALHRRRRQAERIPRSVGPRRSATRHRSGIPRGHRTAEKRSLAYHRIVAKRLNKRLVREAQRRIQKLAEEGRIHPRYAEQWRALLDRPISQIALAITRDTQVGRDLRQNSPFSGVLNEQERRQIIKSVR